MKKIYLPLVTFVAMITISCFTKANAQNEVYWREGFQPDAGCDLTTTAPTTTGGMFFNGQAGVWYAFNAYRTTGTGCTAAGDPNPNPHVRYRNIAGVSDSGYLITPIVGFGIKELHFLRARASRSHTVWVTSDTSALTTNWTLVVGLPSFAGTVTCADTTVMINAGTAKRLKLVSRPLTDSDVDSIWITSVTHIALPITFANIYAVQTNGMVKVSWNIATEINSLRYEIQRSVDGRNFTTIGTNAANNAGKYSFIDNNAASGDNFYRIKGVDKDGTAIFSSVVRVNSNTKNPALSISPNPVSNGTLNVQFYNFEKNTYSLTLYNSAGQNLFSANVTNEGGSFTQTLQLPPSVAPGIYRLLLVNGATKISKTVVVE